MGWQYCTMKLITSLHFYLLAEENGTTTTKSCNEDSSTDESLAKKAKLEVPVAQTFEVSEAFRSGKDTLSQ